MSHPLIRAAGLVVAGLMLIWLAITLVQGVGRESLLPWPPTSDGMRAFMVMWMFGRLFACIAMGFGGLFSIVTGLMLAGGWIAKQLD